MDQSSAPCDRSLPLYRNHTVVRQGKRNITPFSWSNVPHSQSIVQVVNVEGIVYVLPRECDLHKPFLIPLSLDAGLRVGGHEPAQTRTFLHPRSV